eukprot:scaffold56000_cov30-Attheya_sp.AAC.3
MEGDSPCVLQGKDRGLKQPTFKSHLHECALPTLKRREGVSEEETEKTAVSEKAREHAAKICGLVAQIGTGGVTDDDQLPIIN